MVAMGAEEDERPVHQGCMAGFLHLFDRPQILSGKRPVGMGSKALEATC